MLLKWIKEANKDFTIEKSNKNPSVDYTAQVYQQFYNDEKSLIDKNPSTSTTQRSFDTPTKFDQLLKEIGTDPILAEKFYHYISGENKKLSDQVKHLQNLFTPLEVITKNIGDFINPLRIEDNVAEFSSENGYISISNACEIETYDNSSLPSLECIRERIDIQLTKFATLNYIHQRLTKEIPVTAGPTTINGKELTEITSQNIDNDTKLIHSLLKAVGTKETDIASRTQEILAAIPVDQRNDGFAEKISKCMLQKGFINDPKRGLELYTDTPTS